MANDVLSASLFWITWIAALARYLCCSRGRSSSLLLRKNALPSDAEHPLLKGRKMNVEPPHLYSRHLSFRFWRIFTSSFPLKLRTKNEVLNLSVKLIYRSVCWNLTYVKDSVRKSKFFSRLSEKHVKIVSFAGVQN